MDDCCFSTPVQQHRACFDSAKKEAGPFPRKRFVHSSQKTRGIALKEILTPTKSLKHAISTPNLDSLKDSKRRRCERRQNNQLQLGASDCKELSNDCHSDEHLEISAMRTPIKTSYTQENTAYLSKSISCEDIASATTDQSHLDSSQETAMFTCSTPKQTPQNSRRSLSQYTSDSLSRSSHSLSYSVGIQSPFTSLSSQNYSFQQHCNDLTDDDEEEFSSARPLHKSLLDTEELQDEYDHDKCSTLPHLERSEIVHQRSKELFLSIPEQFESLEQDDDMTPSIDYESSSLSPNCLIENYYLSNLSTPPQTPKYESCDVKFDDNIPSPNAPLRQRRTRRSILYGLLANDASIVQAALENDDDPNTEIFVSKNLINNYPDRTCLPLLAAAINLQTDIVRVLLEHGADVNSVNSRNQTAAHLICDIKYQRTQNFRDDAETTQALLRPWYDFNLFLSKRNNNQPTDFFIPSITINSAMCERTEDSQKQSGTYQSKSEYELTRDGACCVDSQSTWVPQPIQGQKKGIQPCKTNIPCSLSTNVENQIMQIMRILLKYSIDCSTRDDNGKTALDYAHDNQLQQVIDLLKQHSNGKTTLLHHVQISPDKTPCQKIRSSLQLHPFPILNSKNDELIMTPCQKHSRRRFPLLTADSTTPVKKPYTSNVSSEEVHVQP